MRLSRLGLPALLLGILAAPRALAAQQNDPDQPPRLSAALGISMNGPADVNQKPKCIELSLPCNTPKTFPDFGIVIGATYRVTAHFALAAEASFYDNRWDSTGVSHDQSNHVNAFLVGPQLMTGMRNFVWWNDTTRLNAFVQFLVGPESSDVLPTRTAIQPGAGIDFKLRPELLSLRIAYDHRITHGSGRNLTGGRISAALVLALPGRD